MSSESIVERYAFRQLEAPPGGAISTEDVLADAWGEAEQIREQARREGEAAGREAGLEAARAEVQSVVEMMVQALAEVIHMRQELLTALEQDAADLAIRIAEHVLAGALEVQPERIVDVARNALRRANDRRQVVLIVNPLDLEVLGDAVQSLKSELGGIEHCDVQADRRINRGGAILRTEAGEIDVTIDAQIERAREVVAATLKREHDGA
jgi:flagellar assembly protein FliH